MQEGVLRRVSQTALPRNEAAGQSDANAQPLTRPGKRSALRCVLVYADYEEEEVLQQSGQEDGGV